MPFQILHVSDIHLGEHCRVHPDSAEVAAKTLVAELIGDLNAHGLLSDIRAVVVSGDFGWYGVEEEFRASISLLHQLSSGIGVPLSDFVLVPGNHDIQWFRQDTINPALKIPNSRKGSSSSYKKFLSEAKGLPEDEISKYLTDVVIFKREEIVIIGLNSSVFESKANAGLGYVGRSQIELVMRHLADAGTLAFAKIVVLHHHLVPIVNFEVDMLLRDPGDRQFSMTIDAAEVISTLLAYNCIVVLHGHMHVPFCGVERRPLIPPRSVACDPEAEIVIAAAGSFGVGSGYCSGIHYQVLTLDNEHLDIDSIWQDFVGGRLAAPVHSSHRITLVPASDTRTLLWDETELRRHLSEDDMKETWLDAVQVLNDNRDAIEELWTEIERGSYGTLAVLKSAELKSLFEEVCSDLKASRKASIEDFEKLLSEKKHRVSFPEYVLSRMESALSRKR